jgi:hypothetical protein
MNRSSGKVLDIAPSFGAMPGVVTVPDESRMNNSGTLTAVTWSRLPTGLWVMNFNGTTSKVVVTNANSLHCRYITVSAWVNINSLASAPTNPIMAKWGAAGQKSWLLSIDAFTQLLSFTVSSDGTATTAGTKSYSPVSGWKHCVGVYDGANITVYINGTAGTPVALAGTIFQSTTNVQIGQDAGVGFPIDASVTLPHIYNYALSAGEVYNLCESEKRLLPDTLAADPVIAGVQWAQAADVWTRIDATGNTLTSFPYSFNDIYPWKGMRRVTMAATGSITGVGDGKGTGLTLTGATGRVMVEIPAFYIKSANPSANVYQWWISSIPRDGFELHPAFVQRGGTERKFIYVGAYDADFEYNGADAAYAAANLQLHSRTAKQPYVGSADCLWEVNFNGGQNQPVVGNSLSTPSGAGYILADYLKTGGTWAGADAAGKLWVQKPGATVTGWLNDETITNTTLGNTLAGGAGLGVNGAVTGHSVTISQCRTLAGNIGAGWGIMNIWSLSVLQLLFYIEYAGANSQTLVGLGITSKAGGTGYNGEVSGFNTIDTNLATNGTGTGTGVNGLTPIAYRGVENLWGNIWQFTDGFDAVDAGYRIIKRNGLGTFANPMAAGSYESSLAIPILTDGYSKNIVYESLLQYLFFSKDTGGDSTHYLYDYWNSHDAGETNILQSGGYWDSGVSAGVGCRYAITVAGYAYRNLGARLEFIGST